MKNVTDSFVSPGHWPSAGSFGFNTDILAALRECVAEGADRRRRASGAARQGGVVNACLRLLEHACMHVN